MTVLPERKGLRRAIVVALVLVVMVVLWFWVFPWADRTFVNRPAIETGARHVPETTTVPAASASMASGVNSIG